MVDNYAQIRELLEFRSNDDFYFLQILQRKKDHKEGKVNGSNNNSRLIKAYYIHSFEYFDFIEPEVKELCKLFNARAGINLNRRSYEKMSFHLLRKVADQIMNKSWDKAHAAYNSVVGAYSQESDKRWIVDVDKDDYDSLDDIEILKKLLNHKDLEPKGEEKVIDVLPSKSGFHIITSPFNIKQWQESIVVGAYKFSDVQVHKNNPTNIFIP